MDIRDLVLRLHDIEAVKFGTFTLKSGIESPIYIDLRLLISYPLLLKAVSEAMWDKIKDKTFELLCGVPYTALPIATAISVAHNIPMVMRRKEVKQYGTKKIIEGSYHSGQRCIVIEDIITSGTSIVETIEPLKYEGVIVKDAVVLIDREQGGRENLIDRNVNLQSIVTLSEILSHLLAAGRIDAETQTKVKNFIIENQKMAVL